MMIADFPEIKIMYLKSDAGVQNAQQTFDTLESKLSTLKGRKFYGLIFGIPPKEEYWVCVEVIDSDNPEKMGLYTGTIPGGKYVQERINNWNEHLPLVGETFEFLAKQHNVDTSRPGIEFYRSMRDMLVRLPIV